jgi:hypothetical protein
MCDSNPAKRTRVRYESPDEQLLKPSDVTFCFGGEPVTCKLNELPEAIKTYFKNAEGFYENINFYIEGWDRVVSHQPSLELPEYDVEDYFYIFTKDNMVVTLCMSTTPLIFPKMFYDISCKGF